MVKKNNNKKASTRSRANLPAAKYADPSTMVNASIRSNQKANAYFYGNMGDSIERRFNGFGPGLGGGNDAFQGIMGAGSTYQAAGYGNYFGNGLLNGIGRMMSGPQSGNNGGFVYLKKFSSQSAFNHQILAQCELAYLDYGIVKNIIDLYSDLATEGIDIYHENKSIHNFYQAWATKVNLRERVHSMFVNLFVFGNVFVHRRWASLNPNEKRSMQRAEASKRHNDNLILQFPKYDKEIVKDEKVLDWYLKNQKALSKAKAATTEQPNLDDDKPDNGAKRIPWEFTFLNPLQIERRGKKIKGESYWVMALDKQDTLDLAKTFGMSTSYRVDIGSTQINLPKEFSDRVSSYQGPSTNYAAEIKLTTDELSVIQAPGKFDWFDWAVPFVYPALKNLAFKDSLRNMEIKASESVINSVYLWKLGNLEKNLPAEDEHFERLADMLQQPGQTLNVLWNDAISAEVIQADINGIFDIKKHESADKDILTALGVPEVLLGGKGGNYSNSYIAVVGVLERLESARERVMIWLNNEIKIISDAMNFRKLPEVKFGYTSLQDDKARQAFLISLYDRNVISADALLEEANTTMAVEASRLKEEEALRDTNIFEPRGPFIKVPPGTPGAPGASSPKTANGRPAGTPSGPTGKQSNPRPPKGQSVSEILEISEHLQVKGAEFLEKIELFCSDRLLQARARENPNLKHLKQLRAEERDRLEQLIYNVFSHIPVQEEKIGDDFIINILNSNAAINIRAGVLEIYTNKIAEYARKFGKEPSREMRRKFIVNAWTAQAILNMTKSE